MTAGVYALVRPGRGLVFRTGVPDAMSRDVAPGHGAGRVFVIQHPSADAPGLLGCVRADAATGTAEEPEAPLNPAGGPLVAALGGSGRPVHGELAVCGGRVVPGREEPEPCGLDDAQQRLVAAMHAAVLQDSAAAGEQPAEPAGPGPFW